MADETSWAVALWLKYGRIEAVVLSSRYAARHTLLMCCCIDSVWSRGTPRFLAEDLNGIRLPPVSALSLPTELRREVEATGRTSGFSAFGLSLLLSTRLSVQVWISERRDWNWSGGAPFNNWVFPCVVYDFYQVQSLFSCCKCNKREACISCLVDSRSSELTAHYIYMI